MMQIPLPLQPKAQLKLQYEQHVDSYERALFELHRRLRLLLGQQNIRATVKYRVKSFSSFWGKVKKRAAQSNGAEQLTISDLLGLRIVCPFLDDLQSVEALLSDHYRIAEREKKGAEFSFKEFGYDSLHFLISLPDDLSESFHIPHGLMVEIQLRTILQDAWAEVEHEIVYKSQITPFDANLRRKLAALNANLSLSDMIFHEIRMYQRELQSQLDRRRVAFMSMVQHEELQKDVTSHGNTAATSGAYPDHPLLHSFSAETQESQLMRALYAHNAHHYDSAVEIYNQILQESGPEQIRTMVLLHRGMAYFALGDYESSEADFRSSIESGGESERALLYLGLCLRQRGREDEALKTLDHCLDLFPRSQEVLLARSQMYYSIGDFSRAIRDCDAVLDLDADYPHARKFRDILNVRLGM